MGGACHELAGGASRLAMSAAHAIDDGQGKVIELPCGMHARVTAENSIDERRAAARQTDDEDRRGVSACRSPARRIAGKASMIQSTVATSIAMS